METNCELGTLGYKPSYRFWRHSVQEELHHARSLGLSVALGGALGAALGAVTGHIGIWVAAGLVMYIAITLVGTWKRDRN